MALMRTTDFTELLDTPLRKIFFMALKDTPAEYQRWINIVETRRKFEDDLRMAEFGSIPQHTEGSAVKFEDALEGTTKRYEPEEFALGYNITQRMRETDQHGIMVKMTSALRKSFRNLFEVQAYNILNNSQATSTRYVGFDGLALLSASHTNLGNSDTQANKPSTDATLSQTAIESAVKGIHAWTGEKGLPAFFTPSMAIVAGDDQFLASKLFKSAMRYDTADNDENWIRKGPDGNGISTVLSSRYFTSTNQWFILCPKDEHDLNMFIGVHPQFETNIDFATGNLQGKGRAVLYTSFGRWQGVYGSSGY